MYGAPAKLDILDTYGQQEFRTLRSYHWSRDLVVLVYSITSRDSFETAKLERERLMRIKEDVPGFCMILVGNKLDLDDSREISFEEGFMCAEE